MIYRIPADASKNSQERKHCIRDLVAIPVTLSQLHQIYHFYKIRKKNNYNRVAIPASRLDDCNQYMLRAFIKFLLGPPFGESGIIFFGTKAALD
jgi:hypothetical protein